MCHVEPTTNGWAGFNDAGIRVTPAFVNVDLAMTAAAAYDRAKKAPVTCYNCGDKFQPLPDERMVRECGICRGKRQARERHEREVTVP